LRIFGKILLFVTGLIILLWGIGDGAYTLTYLINSFPWSNISNNIILLLNNIVSLIMSVVLIFAGIFAILVFIHAKPTRVYRVNKYANFIFFVALISALSRSVGLIIDSVNQVNIENLALLISQLVLDILLPIIYLIGARLVRKSLR
jgi:hypothetical protein